ncbi:hypothetical protein DN752_21050 [Echinicola strongylocentroti]|uniref:Uncharacterized protein n=1 Tax=Echinicola strongylocentroti TaxID=1795355 RepID=A0A2Z4IMU4_9BACT|nr:hypothetical protein [Echinicola strongylocentroti]AWW32431.1 hypothetical protein DN752_21050 [Echinicola strongylocentroti]
MEKFEEKYLTWIAWGLAGISCFMFVMPDILWDSYTISEYGTFVGGTAGPLAALAGFIFIYKTLKNQQEQMFLHDEQFEVENFENTFFKLIDYFTEMSKESRIRQDNNPFVRVLDRVHEEYHDIVGLVNMLNEGDTKSQVELFKNHILPKFKGGFITWKNLLNLVKIILHQIEENNKIEDYHHYRTIFLSRFTIWDCRLVFYFYIMYYDELNKPDRTVLFNFIAMFDSSNLFDSDHFLWLDDFKP